MYKSERGFTNSMDSHDVIENDARIHTHRTQLKAQRDEYSIVLISSCTYSVHEDFVCVNLFEANEDMLLTANNQMCIRNWFQFLCKTLSSS